MVCIAISGFKRPFRAQEAKEFLCSQVDIPMDSDQVKVFWFDKLKKTACLRVEDEELAKIFKKKIEGKVWPPDIGGKL